jgi:hypothetical protein
MSLDKAVDRLRSLDFLAPEVKLNIGGKKGVQTMLGASLTAVYIFGLLASATITVRSYLRTDNPVSMSETLQSEVYPKVDLIEQRLLPIFYGVLGQKDIVMGNDLARFITISVEAVRWVTEYNEQLGKAEIKEEKHILDVKPCGTLPKDSLKIYDYISPESFAYKIMDTVALCIDYKDGQHMTVEGQAADKIFNIFSIKIKPCTLVPSSNCANRYELAALSIIVTSPQTSYQMSNFEKPFQKTANADNYFYINPSQAQMNQVNLRKNIARDYIGLLPKWTQTETFFDIRDIQPIFLERDTSILSCAPQDLENWILCPAYYYYVLKSSGTTVRVGRRYKTIFETFGEIGGVNGVLYMVLALIYARINNRSRDRYLISKTFGFLDLPEYQNNGKGSAPLPADNEMQSLSNRKGQSIGLSTDMKQTRYDENSPSPPNLDPTPNTPSRTYKFPPATPKISEKKRSKFLNVIFPCCKKPTPEELRILEARKLALENISSKLSIVNLIKSMNHLNVITEFLFKDRHKRLLSYVELQHFSKRRAALEKRQAQYRAQYNNSQGAQKAQIKPEFSPECDCEWQEISFSKAVSGVKLGAGMSGENHRGLSNCLEDAADRFFLESLIYGNGGIDLKEPIYKNSGTSLNQLDSVAKSNVLISSPENLPLAKASSNHPLLNQMQDIPSTSRYLEGQEDRAQASPATPNRHHRNNQVRNARRIQTSKKSIIASPQRPHIQSAALDIISPSKQSA